LVEGIKRVTKGIENDKWLFELDKHIDVLKKQKLFLTRGHKYTGVFSFPAGVLKTLHRRLLREGYSISLEEFRKQTFVLEVRGVQMDNEWVRFDES
jgi:hypothetical protein